MLEPRRSSWAQAAPGAAAAEEILVPRDNRILAGPANPAIAFRICSAGVPPAVFEFCAINQDDAGETLIE
jgi:hypothetical protein